MGNFVPVTDEALERARTDTRFRQKLVSEHLDRLTAALNRTKQNVDANAARQLQEGARLAVRLANILHAMADNGTG